MKNVMLSLVALGKKIPFSNDVVIVELLSYIIVENYFTNPALLYISTGLCLIIKLVIFGIRQTA